MERSRGRKVQPDLGLHLDLRDAGKLIFDRVLDGDDVALDRIEMEQRRIERRRLAAAGGSGHEDDAVRQFEQPAQGVAKTFFHAELAEIEIDG